MREPAFARLLISPPDIAIMDEATAALDELSQERMLEFLRTDLVSTTVISVGHRPGLEAYHDRTITLVREEGETAAHAEQPTGHFDASILGSPRRRSGRLGGAFGNAMVRCPWRRRVARSSNMGPPTGRGRSRRG